MTKTFHSYRESIFWGVALILLFAMDVTESSFSFCIPSMLGFHYCPGCGIGHAIHYALHLQFAQSLQAHWLGLPATIGIIYLVLRPFISPNKHHSKNEPSTTTNDHA